MWLYLLNNIIMTNYKAYEPTIGIMLKITCHKLTLCIKNNNSGLSVLLGLHSSFPSSLFPSFAIDCLLSVRGCSVPSSSLQSQEHSYPYAGFDTKKWGGVACLPRGKVQVSVIGKPWMTWKLEDGADLFLTKM